MSLPEPEHGRFASEIDGDRSLEDRRRAVDEATGCRNFGGIAMLALWSVFVVPVSCLFLLKSIRRVVEGAFGGPDLIGILAISEFVIPTLLGWWMVASSIAARRHPSEAGAFLVVDQGERVELRERLPSPVFMGLVAVFAANFPLLFVVGFCYGDQTPLPVAIAASLFLVLVFATATALTNARFGRSGPILQLDLVRGVATFQPAGHGENPQTVAMTAVRDVDTELKMVDEFKRPIQIMVRLHAEDRDLNLCCYPIAELPSEVAAKVCVQWLRRRFGLASVEDPSSNVVCSGPSRSTP